MRVEPHDDTPPADLPTPSEETSIKSYLVEDTPPQRLDICTLEDSCVILVEMVPAAIVIDRASTPSLTNATCIPYASIS